VRAAVAAVRGVILTLLGVGMMVVPVQGQVPTPESVLGFRPGDDFELATYEQSMDYFRRLDEASDRVELRLVGRTSEGRDWYVALVSSPENLARVDHWRDLVRTMGSSRDLTKAEARQ